MTIRALTNERAYLLSTSRSTYALALGGPGAPVHHLHWGGPIDERDLDGLRGLSDAVHGSGMRFGVWFEQLAGDYASRLIVLERVSEESK